MVSFDSNASRILVTGASGYVGGRLVQRLARRGYRVRCMARRPEYLTDRVGSPVEVVGGDVMEAKSLQPALAGVEVAYYLVHSMGAKDDFEERDRRGAENFARIAKACGIRRIVYLGGLGDETRPLSAHLRSRHEVGRILSASGVPTLEFRASIVLGSGSLSFEMIRSLTERLPVMITPRWVHVPAQPIAIDDLLDYLERGARIEIEKSAVFEIGGSDVISYGGLMKEYARQRGLRRWIIPVPVLTPGLSSRWLGIVTPLYARVGEKLIDSLRHPTCVTDDRARRLFGVEPMGVSPAIASALRNEDREFAETRWSDAFSSGDTLKDWGGKRLGNRLVDSRSTKVPIAPERVFAAVQRLGGGTGWYYGNWLWRLRGLIDLAAGGIGLRRGRRDPNHLRRGDVLDWWRVEEIVAGRLLRLSAEMKVPGRAWLQFEVEPDATGGCRFRQSAVFDPMGLFGLVYWYTLYPIHKVIFAGMFRGIVQAAAGRPDPTHCDVSSDVS